MLKHNIIYSEEEIKNTKKRSGQSAISRINQGTSKKQYRDNWDRIFGNKKKVSDQTEAVVVDT